MESRDGCSILALVIYFLSLHFAGFCRRPHDGSISTYIVVCRE